MRPKRAILVIAALGVGAVAPAQFAVSGENPIGIVITKDRALLIGFETVVVPGILQGFVVSPDDRYIAALRMDDPQIERFMQDPTEGSPVYKTSLVIWNAQTGKSVEAEIDIGDMSTPRGFAWLSDSSAIVLGTQENTVDRFGNESSTYRSMVINPRTGKVAQHRLDNAGGRRGTIVVSPVQPLAIELITQQILREAGSPVGSFKQSFRLTTLDRNGKVVKTRTVEIENSTVDRKLYWSRDGRELLVQTLSPDDTGQKSVLVFDPLTLEYTETTRPLTAYTEEAEEFDAQIVTSPVVVERLGVAQNQVASWLEGDPSSFGPRALITVAPLTAEFSPRHTMLVYVKANALVVRRVSEVDRSTLEEAQRAAQRTEKLSNAKQIALAALMYSMDNDDYLPNPQSFQSDVSPYLRNADLFEGFVYTFKGGRMSDVEFPATTELGYTLVEGGRIVAYLDSHAKFIPD